MNDNELTAPIAYIDEYSEDDVSNSVSISNESPFEGHTSEAKDTNNLCESLEDLVKSFDVKVNDLASTRKKTSKIPKRSITCDMIYDRR